MIYILTSGHKQNQTTFLLTPHRTAYHTTHMASPDSFPCHEFSEPSPNTTTEILQHVKVLENIFQRLQTALEKALLDNQDLYWLSWSSVLPDVKRYPGTKQLPSLSLPVEQDTFCISFGNSITSRLLGWPQPRAGSFAHTFWHGCAEYKNVRDRQGKFQPTFTCLRLRKYADLYPLVFLFYNM